MPKQFQPDNGAPMTDSIINNTVVLKGPQGSTDLLPEMDIFSAGYIFTDTF